MSLEVVVPEEYASAVLADLSRRRCGIEHIDMRGTSRVSKAFSYSYLSRDRASKGIFMLFVTLFHERHYYHLSQYVQAFYFLTLYISNTLLTHYTVVQALSAIQ